MTVESAIAFAIGMFFLALSPGPGLATIISRALASGPVAGLAVTGGLVLADFFFMGIAMAGLTVIASAMGPLFQVVKYAGAAYLALRTRLHRRHRRDKQQGRELRGGHQPIAQ